MTLKRPPASVALSALLIALTGGVVFYVGLVRLPEGLVLGSALMLVAAGVWQGFAWARWTAFVGALIALLIGAYGIWGTSMVAEQFFACPDDRVASLAISFPAGMCGRFDRIDWFSGFGAGLALIGVGLVGLITVWTVLRRGDHFRGARDMTQPGPERQR